jgi:hypothetical protein
MTTREGRSNGLTTQRRQQQQRSGERGSSEFAVYTQALCSCSPLLCAPSRSLLLLFTHSRVLTLPATSAGCTQAKTTSRLETTGCVELDHC